MLNTQSQIGVRMLTFDGQPVDESFLWGVAAAAITLRARCAVHLDQCTDAYRVVHAEGDGLPGLIVGSARTLFGVIELFSFAMYKRAGALAAVLAVKPLGLEEVLIRADERVQDAEGFRVSGAAGGRKCDQRAAGRAVGRSAAPP